MSGRRRGRHLGTVPRQASRLAGWRLRALRTQYSRRTLLILLAWLGQDEIRARIADDGVPTTCAVGVEPPLPLDTIDVGAKPEVVNRLLVRCVGGEWGAYFSAVRELTDGSVAEWGFYMEVAHNWLRVEGGIDVCIVEGIHTKEGVCCTYVPLARVRGRCSLLTRDFAGGARLAHRLRRSR